MTETRSNSSGEYARRKYRFLSSAEQQEVVLENVRRFEREHVAQSLNLQAATDERGREAALSALRAIDHVLAAAERELAALGYVDPQPHPA